MRFLVTGAAGFIGSHLSDALIADGHDVVGIDNLSTGRRGNVSRECALVEGDIRRAQDIPQGDWDVVYHCAASYRDRGAWESDASTNVLGTINVVREAKRAHARIVYFQTSLCYGPTPQSPVPLDAPLAPVGSYAVSKTAGEAYIRDSGVDWVSLRLANIYGPRNLSGPVPTFYQRLSEGRACTIVDSRRDFVYVDDLVKVAKRAATTGHGQYHVSTGHDYPIRDLYCAVAAAMQLDMAPPPITPRGPDDVATLLLDPTDTYAEFGWSARTPLVTGVRAAVDFYRHHPVTETFTHLAMRG